MHTRSTSGYTLVETMFVVVILGILVAMGLPSMKGYRQAYDLRAATENVAGQITLARSKAMATDVTQEIRFQLDYQSSDYHTFIGGAVAQKWDLPKGIVYHWGTGTNANYRMTSNGRCLDSGMIILEDPRGKRDTVTVLRSGLIIQR